MAEFVEFRAEEWVSELEQLERIRLFDSKEIKCIATKRREFEYKIQRRTKCKEDFLKYIQFEVDLHKIILGRRKKCGINKKKASIEFKQTHRIASLFKQVLLKFQDDIKLWMTFFQFCKEVKFHSLVNRMLVRMMQIHSNNPELWVFASNWEFKESNSVENARQFLTKGLRYHPSSELLYVELFKLELEFLKKTKIEKEIKMEKEEWKPNEVADNIIEGKLVMIVYESAVKEIPGADFKVKLLNVSKSFEGTFNIQKKIFEDLKEKHINDEITWDTMAKEVLNFPCESKNKEDGDGMEVETVKKSPRQRLEATIGIYEEAVKKLNTDKMWNYYLDYVIELNSSISSLPKFKFNLLQRAFRGALASHKVNEKYFLHLIQILKKSGKDKKTLGRVLQKGCEQHPKSIKIWYSCIRFFLTSGQGKIGLKAFDKALKYVPDALPLWELVINYMNLRSHPKIEKAFKYGLSRGGDVSQVLKPLYLKWLVKSKGIERARKVFESKIMQHPPNLDFYNEMAQLELSQNEVSKENVRKCYDLACHNFGRDNADVWLERIKFELTKGDGSKVSQIFRRAMQTLDPEASDVFLAEYNQLKNEIS